MRDRDLRRCSASPRLVREDFQEDGCLSMDQPVRTEVYMGRDSATSNPIPQKVSGGLLRKLQVSSVSSKDRQEAIMSLSERANETIGQDIRHTSTNGSF